MNSYKKKIYIRCSSDLRQQSLAPIFSLRTSQRISLIELLNQDGYKTNGIKCGGDIELNQFREQWTDGANALSLQPSIAVGYSRNIHTIEALKKNGYKIMTSNEFISEFDDVKNDKIFITLNSTELCRGRGGPRCLTLPISRRNNG